MTFPGLLIFFDPLNKTHGTPWGGVGQNCLAENESHIYPNMCAKFGCGLTVESKSVGVQTDRQTDKGTLQLYIVD